MNNFSYLKIIALIAVFVLLLLVFFLLTVKTKNKLSNRLIASYLILTAIDISGFFIAENITNNHPNLEIFRWTLCLLNIPLFYLYVLSLCYTDFRLKFKHALHTAPFIILNLILIPRIYLANDTYKKYFFEHHFETTEMVFFQFLIEVQYLLYIIGIFLILKKYRKIYLENFANSNTATYKWLFQITIVFIVAHYFDTFKNLLRYTDYHTLLIFINDFIGIIALLITCWFVLKALNYPELFRGIDSKLQLAKDFTSKTAASKNQDITVIASQIDILKKHMIDKKPYLDQSFTIQDLANQINIPVRELSILINLHMHQHFFDFVNQYRIENAMEILRNYSKSELTVLEILYKVGFNSKSSFHTAFKKHTSLTPTEYRNSLL
ncbi:histidine kinase [Flavobacterium sp. KMS]|uniref:helix-turn-helix domain-containing protein n=1 Tax=Flavobacterium sp. KMS TaxID=1566023 RepID=UPI00057FB01B|nr:helix-turn-helix domain-containing protein [Flavobacterium sp. KMS]KIA99273.1 histidine kinase [Flavobacterium sp. KMS]